ncbi:MAG: DUF6323 family protein [Clostridiales bacterium]|nr:DUF6323 family protein [Clostridiales bacterium]
MSFELLPFSAGLVQKQAISDVINCNSFTQQFGLALTPEQAAVLVETRFTSLKNNGRVEFGGGVIDKIIMEFCDSPYISSHNYAETLNELTDMFYLFKNETMDLITDDELIKFMKKSFDGICQGSLELLSGRELYRLSHNLRFGLDGDYTEDISDHYGGGDYE